MNSILYRSYEEDSLSPTRATVAQGRDAMVVRN